MKKAHGTFKIAQAMANALNSLGAEDE